MHLIWIFLKKAWKLVPKIVKCIIIEKKTVSCIQQTISKSIPDELSFTKSSLAKVGGVIHTINCRRASPSLRFYFPRAKPRSGRGERSLQESSQPAGGVELIMPLPPITTRRSTIHPARLTARLNAAGSLVRCATCPTDRHCVNKKYI